MVFELLFKKAGSTTIYGDNGSREHATLLAFEPTVLLDSRINNNGAQTIRIACGTIRKNNSLDKSVRSIYEKKNFLPHRRMREFVLPENTTIPDDAFGKQISLTYFEKNKHVDVFGRSIGKGFSGVMKRHNFSGGNKTHGNSKSHRSQGSTGQCQDAGKVWKGKEMAGRMGNTRTTIKNLKILMVDPDRGLLIVRGAVPGHIGADVFVRYAKHFSDDIGSFFVDLLKQFQVVAS